MEENERTNTNLFLGISMAIIVVLIVGIICLIIMNQKANNQLKNQLDERNTKIEKLENEITELKKTDLDGTTKKEKAIELVKDVEDAVNDEDWDFLENLLNDNKVETAFKKYGIYDYKVDKSDYVVYADKNSLEEDSDGDLYVFNESYKSVYPLGDSVGSLLVIDINDDGTFEVRTLCVSP